MKKLASHCIALMLAAAGLGTQACQSADLKKAAQASQDIAISIKLAIATNQDLAEQGLITGAEALAVDRVLLVLNQADQLFVAKAKTYPTWNTGTKSALAALFGDITSAINQLQSIVSVLLNQQARATFAAVLASLTIATATLQAVLT